MIRPSSELEAPGEFVSIPDRFVVAPAWGRLHPGPLEEGRRLRRGAVIGRITQGRYEQVLRAPGPTVFVRWLARQGQWVAPGTPLALLRFDE